MTIKIEDDRSPISLFQKKKSSKYKKEKAAEMWSEITNADINS